MRQTCWAVECLCMRGSDADNPGGTPVPDDGSIVLRRLAPDGDDPLLRMVVDIFGYEPGQGLTPSMGLNEF